MGKKYVIEMEDKPVAPGLWKVKGFNSLVFDKSVLDKLKEYHEPVQIGHILTDGTDRWVVFDISPSGIISGFNKYLKYKCAAICDVGETLFIDGYKPDVQAFMWRIKK